MLGTHSRRDRPGWWTVERKLMLAIGVTAISITGAAIGGVWSEGSGKPHAAPAPGKI